LPDLKKYCSGMSNVAASFIPTASARDPRRDSGPGTITVLRRTTAPVTCQQTQRVMRMTQINTMLVSIACGTVWRSATRSAASLDNAKSRINMHGKLTAAPYFSISAFARSFIQKTEKYPDKHLH